VTKWQANKWRRRIGERRNGGQLNGGQAEAASNGQGDYTYGGVESVGDEMAGAPNRCGVQSSFPVLVRYVHSRFLYRPCQIVNNVCLFTLAAMLRELDTSVGQVVEALKISGMLENSIIIFSTDNGGPADGFNLNAASNWPLRGVKNTLWEGGVRGAGMLSSLTTTSDQRI